MITQQSFMFLSTFEKLRVELINNHTIINMAHLGAHAFEEIGGEVVQATTFVNKNNLIENYKSTFHRLTEFNSESRKEEEFHNDKPDNIKELYENLKERILNEFEDIEIVATKLYIVFKTSNKIIISIEAFKGQLKGWINLKNTKLIDPFNKTRDVSNIGHHGIGDYEMKIANDEDIDYFISLFKQAYKEKL